MGLSEDLKKKKVMEVQQGSQSLLCIFFKFFISVMWLLTGSAQSTFFLSLPIAPEARLDRDLNQESTLRQGAVLTTELYHNPNWAPPYPCVDQRQLGYVTPLLSYATYQLICTTINPNELRHTVQKPERGNLIWKCLICVRHILWIYSV
jgi:hypothetical protein